MREALLAAYRRHGYEIRCGEMVTRHLRDGTLNREAVLSECASAWKDGRRLDTGWGMSWQELAVLEFLAGISDADGRKCIVTDDDPPSVMVCGVVVRPHA